MLKFVTGILCGVGVGLLIAPAPGERTRRQLIRAAREPQEVAREAVSNLREKAGDMGANVGRQAAQEAVDKVIPERLSPSQKRTG